MSQLLKLPAFIQHFKEHRQKDSSLTLIGFLRMHYANGDQKDADYAKDMQLPFKTHDNCSLQVTVDRIPCASILSTRTPIHKSQPSLHFPDDVFVNSSFFANIWQPPKSC